MQDSLVDEPVPDRNRMGPDLVEEVPDRFLQLLRCSVIASQRADFGVSGAALENTREDFI